MNLHKTYQSAILSYSIADWGAKYNYYYRSVFLSSSFDFAISIIFSNDCANLSSSSSVRFFGPLIWFLCELRLAFLLRCLSISIRSIFSSVYHLPDWGSVKNYPFYCSKILLKPWFIEGLQIKRALTSQKKYNEFTTNTIINKETMLMDIILYLLLLQYIYG